MRVEPGWGVWFEPERPALELAELARQAEAEGASHVFVADEGTERDLFVVMATIACATSRIKIGAGITNPHSRHPVTLAAAFASLAEVAPGRILVGLGAGGSRVLVPLGIEADRPYTALAECVDVVERLLAGEEVSSNGIARAHRARLSWAPGSLELALAGRRPRASRLAATRASWVLFASRALAGLAELCARVRAVGREAGNSPRIAWSAYLAWEPGMVDDVRPHFTYIATDMPDEERLAAGLDDELASRVREVMLRQGMGAAAALLPDSVVGRYALIGTREEIAARLAALREEARPDLFLLPMNNYRRAREFISEAAQLLTTAGFTKEATGAHAG